MTLWADQAVPLRVLFRGLSWGYSYMAIRLEYPVQYGFTHVWGLGKGLPLSLCLSLSPLSSSFYTVSPCGLLRLLQMATTLQEQVF